MSISRSPVENQVDPRDGNPAHLEEYWPNGHIWAVLRVRLPSFSYQQLTARPGDDARTALDGR